MAACVPQPDEDSASLHQKQRGIFEEVAEFFQVLSAERAIDDAMIAAHSDRHAMADHDLVAVVDYRRFCDPPDRKDEALGRIDHRGKTVDSHPAKI